MKCKKKYKDGGKAPNPTQKSQVTALLDKLNLDARPVVRPNTFTKENQRKKDILEALRYGRMLRNSKNQRVRSIYRSPNDMTIEGL
jgi:hypothetical protein